jgi:hypothetical protein
VNFRIVTRRAGGLTVAIATLAAFPLLAQNPGGRGGPPVRQMIEQRFVAQIKSELGLSEEDGARMQRILVASAERRRQMEQEERSAQQALRDQLRPGVAAQTDSVVKLLDRLTTLRVSFAQAARDEMRELGTVLSPVQQAQFLLMRDRMMARAQELRMQRPPGGGSH